MLGVGLLQFLFLLTFGVPLGQEHGAVRVVVPEGGDAVLPVSIDRDAERDYFEWSRVGPGGETLNEVFKYDAGDHYNNVVQGQSEQFKGRVSHFKNELRHGNASIGIRKTTAADSGNYICSFPRLQPPQRFYFELVVAATPKPSINILNATADWSYLQCEVPGASLNTKAEWQSRDGNKLEAEEEQVPEKDHVFISLYANVTRTDLYLCVVSQEDIKHRVSAETFVFISEKQKKMESKECYSTAAMLMVGFALGAVIVIAVQALLVFAKRIKILHNKGSALQGEEEINMGNGFSNGTNGHVRVPSEEPLNSVSDSIISDEKVCV